MGAFVVVGARVEKSGLDTVRHWRIMLRVEFIETPTFTRLIEEFEL